MSLQNKMAEKKANAAIRESVKNNLYKNERDFRAAQYLDAWKKVPKIGAGLDKLPFQEAANTAIMLNAQATHMANLREGQLSQSFSQFTPENMLRLVRLAMPNLIRNKVFTEFAMESVRDSIKYIKPVYEKPFKKGASVDNKHTKFGEDDPWGYDKGKDLFNSNNVEDYNADYRRALYESTEDRFTSELINGEVDVAEGVYTVTFKDDAFSRGEGLIKGYTVVYGDDEKDTILIEDKRTGAFFTAAGYEGSTAEYGKDSEGNVTLKVTLAGKKATEGKTVRAYARADLENDFEGDNLGEVSLIMTDYEFRPRPTTIGVSWSQLAEITLDASFGVSAQETLVDYAAQAIRVNLDYKAIKLAYAAAKTNKKYIVEFDAAYAENSKEGYIHNAATFTSAVETMADIMLNDINRGGVSRMVAGPSAGTYTQLTGLYTNKGRQSNIGAHQVGEFDGIPLFKVPSSIIPTDEILTVWKNDDNESDVSIAFGTLVPFFNTGVIQRKNFYKEAGIASYGDWALLNRRYLGIIKIKGMKDTTVEADKVVSA